MTDEDTKTPDPFSPEDYAAVKPSIMNLFETATAAGQIGSATEQEAAQLLREGLEQVERDHGLNVIPFPAPRSSGAKENGE